MNPIDLSCRPILFVLILSTLLEADNTQIEQVLHDIFYFKLRWGLGREGGGFGLRPVRVEKCCFHQAN